MSDYREQSEKAKALRREPAPDTMKVPARRKKVAKPWAVMSAGWLKVWTVARCATEQEAQAYIDKRLRSAPWDAKKPHKYWIEGPKS